MNLVRCDECGAPVLMIQRLDYRWPLEPEDIGREAQAVAAKHELEPELGPLRIVCGANPGHVVGPALVKDSATGTVYVDGLRAVGASTE